jgi:hypothetical protein
VWHFRKIPGIEGEIKQSLYNVLQINCPSLLTDHKQTYTILLNNERDAALSSRIYSSLRGYMFWVLSAPIIRSTIKTVDAIIGAVHVSVWCGLN